MKTAYREFEERVARAPSPRGAKTELVKTAIQQSQGPFQIINIQQMCPGVGIDLIRRVLKQLRASGQVECLGRGQHAKWQKTKEYQLGNTHSNG